MLSSLNLGVKKQKYFLSSSNMLLDKKTVLKIWLNPGLNLAIVRGTGPRSLKEKTYFLYQRKSNEEILKGLASEETSLGKWITKMWIYLS